MEADETRPSAWQPFTFRGVAAFAQASVGRLLATQLVVALISGGVLAACFQFGWNPSIRAAVADLPPEGEIDHGELNWHAPAPVRLGTGTLLSFVIDPEDRGELGQTADVECIFLRKEMRIRSSLGFVSIPYPGNETFAFNRPELLPWWGAWRPITLALIVLVSAILLVGSWWVLAVVYLPVIRLVAFYADRAITSTDAWKLAGAAVLPAAFLMDVTIAAYASHRLSLLQLLTGFVAHIVTGWIFVLIAPTRLPRMARGTTVIVKSKNPFAPPPPPS